MFCVLLCSLTAVIYIKMTNYTFASLPVWVSRCMFINLKGPREIRLGKMGEEKRGRDQEELCKFIVIIITTVIIIHMWHDRQINSLCHVRSCEAPDSTCCSLWGKVVLSTGFSWIRNELWRIGFYWLWQITTMETWSVVLFVTKRKEGSISTVQPWLVPDKLQEKVRLIPKSRTLIWWWVCVDWLPDYILSCTHELKDLTSLPCEV